MSSDDALAYSHSKAHPFALGLAREEIDVFVCILDKKLLGTFPYILAASVLIDVIENDRTVPYTALGSRGYSARLLDRLSQSPRLRARNKTPLPEAAFFGDHFF